MPLPLLRPKRRIQNRLRRHLHHALIDPVELGHEIAARSSGARLLPFGARASASPPPAPERPLLLACGDSWFDYPGSDVLSCLRASHGFSIASDARRGARLVDLAYSPARAAALWRMFERLERSGSSEPFALLLSAGGNDVAADDFGRFLFSPRGAAVGARPALDEASVARDIDGRLAHALRTWLTVIDAIARARLGRSLPVILHGYAVSSPDGRGYGAGRWFDPGPWLAPAFAKRGHHDAAENRAIIAAVIDRWNAMLQRVASERVAGPLVALDLRGVLPSEEGHAHWWADELHPSPTGFARVAQEFAHAARSFGVQLT